MATIQGIYVALFGRPADPLGLAYFNEVTDNGADLTAIGDLAGTAEYQDRFEGMNNAQIVTAIYQSLFGRAPELAGLEFFVNELNSGRQNINTVAINILDGAKGDDAALVEAKIAAADQFTSAIAADADALARYQGETGAAFGRSFLNQIADADDEFTDAQVAAQVAAFGDGNPDTGIPGTPGAILTLTGGADVVDPSATGLQFKSTANDDNIRAIAADSLNSSDVINGGAGFDTLNISLNAVDNGAGGLTASAPVISNVERINNSDGASILNLASVSGLQQLWSNANTGTAFTYTNASTATVFGTSGLTGVETHTINVDFAGALTGRTTVNIATTNAGGDAVFDFGTDSAGIEAVSINAASGAGAVSLDPADMTKLDTITVTGAGRLTVDAAVTALTTFDASGNTGGVLYTSGVLTKDATITSGSGNDVLDLDAADTDLTISTGAGHDQVTLGEGDNTVDAGAGNDIITITATGGRNEITLGAGNDTFVLGAADSSSYTATEDGYTTITDFGTSDKINLVGAGAFTLLTGADQIDVENAVASAAAAPDASLATIVAAVDVVTGGGDLTVFEYAGNTYVFGDVGGDAVLVELTGSVSLAASNFILV